MKIIASKNSKNLAQKISQLLDCDFVEANAYKFDNGEVCIKGLSVCDEEVVIVASLYPDIHDNLMETFFLIDAVRRSGENEVILVAPYIPYSRQDRDEEFSGFSTILNILNVLGVSKVVTLDIHSNRLHELSAAVNIEELTSMDIISGYIKSHLSIDMLVSADAGRSDFIKTLSNKVGLPYALLSKVRNQDTTCNSVIIQGEVEGKSLLIVDDIVDSGHTLKSAAEILLASGAKNIDAFVTHGVLAERSIDLMQNAGIRSLTITDSINNMDFHSNWVSVISIVEIIATNIKKQAHYEARVFI